MVKDDAAKLMERAAYLQALMDVQLMIGERMEALDKEHRRLRSNCWGGPRARHYEIMQQLRGLKELGIDILAKSRKVANGQAFMAD